MTSNKLQTDRIHSQKSHFVQPMLSLKSASKQLQKISLASALQSKRKIDSKGIFSNVKSGKYHTNVTPQNLSWEQEIAVTPGKPLIFRYRVLNDLAIHTVLIQSYSSPRVSYPTHKQAFDPKI
jgi:hypothetical protein